MTPTAWALILVFLFIQGAHFYTLIAHFNGNANYTPADSAERTVTVSKATPAVSASWTGWTFDGTAHAATSQVSGVGSPAAEPHDSFVDPKALCERIEFGTDATVLADQYELDARPRRAQLRKCLDEFLVPLVWDQIRDRHDTALAPQERIGKRRYIAHMDAAAHYHATFHHRLQRLRNERADRRKQ